MRIHSIKPRIKRIQTITKLVITAVNVKKAYRNIFRKVLLKDNL